MAEARARWKILSSALLKTSHKVKSPAGEQEVIRFPSYGLVRATHSKNAQLDYPGKLWYRIQAEGYSTIDLQVCLIDPTLTTSSANDLIGFNNTGNVCIWPAEECLTMELLENYDLKDKNVIELGGGMTSLAGLITAQAFKPKSMVLTDGNEKSVDNLNEILDANKDKFDDKTDINARLLRWDAVPADLKRSFDLVICADCLFFDDSRESLSQCIHDLLRPGGIAVIVAPRRGHTFENFSQICENRFQIIRKTSEYSKRMSNVLETLVLDKKFNENIHRPILLEIMPIIHNQKQLHSNL